MFVINKSKKKVLSGDAVMQENVIGKCLGLMFRRKPQSMILRFSREGFHSLHMWFVFFPIDVLFLDKSKKVVEIKERFLPWTMYRPRRKAQYVVELPHGSVQETSTEVGDHITFTASNL